MSVHAKIDRALIAYLSTLSFSPAIPLVKNTEDPYEPVIDQPYLEARHFYSETVSPSVGSGTNQYLGILQVTVVHPRLVDPDIALETADEVIRHFEKGTTIYGEGVKIKIYRQPTRATPAGDGAWFRIPVSINYQCMA